MRPILAMPTLPQENDLAFPMKELEVSTRSLDTLRKNLAESGEELRLAMDFAIDGITVGDLEGNILEVNGVAVK